jgi:hypothetical protein
LPIFFRQDPKDYHSPFDIPTRTQGAIWRYLVL